MWREEALINFGALLCQHHDATVRSADLAVLFDCSFLAGRK